ncbi:hypothetical protein SELMODRAFT_83491 [Selaginella moellendorffii]|uniref:Pentacotripeptide-repeat region of PRORP domain-containing protein n=2 Tax=Selaginella moellendorffii TaxID=88036 RepID=D8R2H4_SELML|nr:hypothetical protein SELMODRAFT_83491 [Selaginella moellendorffii]
MQAGENCVVWTALVTAFSQHGRSIQAKELFDQISEKTIVSWNAMVAAYAQNGHFQRAKKLFDELPERSTSSWNSIIAANSTDGRWKFALELFHSMTLDGVRADDITLLCVLFACSHSGLLGVSRNFFRCISKDWDALPTLQHYHAMIDLLARSGEVGRSQELVETMPYVSSSIAWASLLGSYRTQGGDHRSLAKLASGHVTRIEAGKAGAYVLLSNTIFSTYN